MNNTQQTYTNDRIAVLVCLSASPSTRHVIDTARKLAGRGTEAIALYVGSAPDSPQLRENIAYAQTVGFEVHTAESADIALTISEFARRAGTTDLFIGRSAPSGFFQQRRSISDQLSEYLPGVDIHVIPDSRASSYPQEARNNASITWNLRDVLIVLAVMTAATLLSVWFDRSPFSNANIITIYILAVLIASLLTSHQIYGILAAVLYILLFNFLFIDPRFTLLVYDPGYVMTYFVTVIAALITGSLTIRMKQIVRTSAQNAYQAKVLLDTSNRIERAKNADEIIRTGCIQLVHLLGRTVTWSQADRINSPPDIYPAGTDQPDLKTVETERDAVIWTLENRHNSGAFTSHFSDYRCRYFCIHSIKTAFGVIGIEMNGKPLSEFENTILLSILNELALALENEAIEAEWQAAEIAAQKESLRAGLLRSISHDLRTPLTSIYGNASNLAMNDAVLSEEDRRKIYGDLMEDSEWLNAQMENILVMTRLENKDMLHITTESVEDVIEESLRHIRSHAGHTIKTVYDPDVLFARMDVKLIMQVLINLIDNAIKYTPEGSTITIRTVKTDNRILVSVEDDGGGIPNEEKPRVFEPFYTGHHTLNDSYRSLGLGLNLCMLIMKAHGTSIEVFDNTPHGTVFRFELIPEEVTAYE